MDGTQENNPCLLFSTKLQDYTLLKYTKRNWMYIGSTFIGQMRPRWICLAQVRPIMFGVNLARTTTVNAQWNMEEGVWWYRAARVLKMLERRHLKMAPFMAVNRVKKYKLTKWFPVSRSLEEEEYFSMIMI